MLTAINYYHQLIQNDPQSALRQCDLLEQKFIERNIMFAGKPSPFHLRPHLMSSVVRQNLENAAHTVLEASLKAELGLFGGDAEKLYDALFVSENERILLRVEPGYRERVIWSRLDAFLGAGDDDIKFLEFNNDAPAGIGYSALMAQSFLELPIMEEFQTRYSVAAEDARPQLLKALLDTYKVWGGSEHPQIAIVDWQDVRTSADFQILQAFFEASGYRTIICDPRAVEMRDGKLYHQDFRIDLVYRRVVTSELLEKFDECHDFVDAYRTHAACFINTFRCRISENKAFMEFLTDPSHLGHLSADERLALDRYLPWTRHVSATKTDFHGQEIELGEFIAANREQFVLKPADSYGGKDVYVGTEVEQSIWESAVHAAISQTRWVVQERVATPVEPFPVRVGDSFEFRDMKFNVNPFYLGGVTCGAVTRTSTDAVINVSAGGGSVPSFTVSPR
ncbi:MAG TPA: glutathionylspermidine synthase family protein [Acidobacteriota bacterium]|nr:glutathionylspermidine synthase family protein [Acidobacteriota bacterium]HNB72008.1 glutathionylspermidine synthase family protein [Acidobacteriota bacterium]HNH81198.1 glutathionylspermidine synthase family protein [Acidobacteriota bacterium]